MTVKIAFIGGGRMALIHAASLLKIENVQIAGIYDVNPVNAKIFAQKFNAARIYQSRGELLEDKEKDAVAICDYGHQHADEMLAVMRAGVRKIFCEKPAIRSISEIRPILEEAEKTKSMICIGHVRRYFAEQIKMKEIIDSGILGKIHFAKVHYCNAGFSREWGLYFSSYELSGGTALDMGVHYIDLFNWLFGHPVKAGGCAFGMERRLSKDQKPCDYFSGHILYENDVLCGLETSYQRFGEKDYLFEVYGDRATLLLSGGKLKLITKDSVTEYNLPKNNPHDDQMAAFVKMITADTPCSCMLKDGIAAAETVIGLLEASDRSTFCNCRELESC